MLADSLMTNFNFHLDMGTKIILLSELQKKEPSPRPWNMVQLMVLFELKTMAINNAKLE